jgi:hypothetical protein
MSSFDAGTRERSIEENGFDSWDMSSVSPQVRRAVIESSTPPQQVILETIPGSRPGSPTILPVALTRPQSATGSFRDVPASSYRMGSGESEAHIHPLFRSDSPTPPPSATPGTIVTAAPGAGRILDNGSIKSLRVRSGSAPATPSPLIHSKSFKSRVVTPIREPIPAIPDFILSAGQRSSLTGYAKRRASSTNRNNT